MSRVVVCRPAWTPDDGREDGAALQAVRAALGGDGQPADGDPDLAPLPQTDRGPQLQLRLRPHRLRQLRKEVGCQLLWCYTFHTANFNGRIFSVPPPPIFLKN